MARMTPRQMGYRAPRRRIEKVWNRINHVVTNTISVVVLHTVEDSKTLVRSIVQLSVINESVAGFMDINISVAPKATTIAGCSTSEVLDQDDSKHTLLRWFIGQKASALEEKRIEAESKGMRKLQPGDQIILQDKGSAANIATLLGYVQFFFKE